MPCEICPIVEVRSLYDLYPDFAIDVEAEQAALLRADIVVWQHPLYWYSVPPLMQALVRQGARARLGRTAKAARAARQVCQWVTTTGGDRARVLPGGIHGHPLSTRSSAPSRRPRASVGMRWEPPLVLHGAQRIERRRAGELARTLPRASGSARATDWSEGHHG